MKHIYENYAEYNPLGYEYINDKQKLNKQQNKQNKTKQQNKKQNVRAAGGAQPKLGLLGCAKKLSLSKRSRFAQAICARASCWGFAGILQRRPRSLRCCLWFCFVFLLCFPQTSVSWSEEKPIKWHQRETPNRGI